MLTSKWLDGRNPIFMQQIHFNLRAGVLRIMESLSKEQTSTSAIPSRILRSLRVSIRKRCWLCKFIDEGCQETNRPRNDPVQYVLKASDEPQFDFRLEFRADRSTSDAFLVGFSLEKQHDRSSLLDLAELYEIQSWTGDDAVWELVVSWSQLCQK